MADALRKLYEGWLALRWPIGTPSGGPDWGDVETAFRAGYHEGVHDRTPGVSPCVPAGWKLVPVEPTKDMRMAGYEYTLDALEVWQDMLAKVPVPCGVPVTQPAGWLSGWGKPWTVLDALKHAHMLLARRGETDARLDAVLGGTDGVGEVPRGND